jgi:hypothetical protein
MYAVLALVLLAQPQKEQPPQIETKLDPLVANAVKPDDKDTPLKKLQKERVRERAIALERLNECIQVGKWNSNYFLEQTKLQIALAENLAELLDKPADKVKCYEMRLASAKEFEKFIAKRVEVGSDPAQNLNIATAARADAEIELTKLKETLKIGTEVAASDPEALLKEMLTQLTALATALEEKEPAEKIKAAFQKMKAAGDKLDALKLTRDEKTKLETKYKKELDDAVSRLLKASISNPEGARILSELGGPSKK